MSGDGGPDSELLEVIVDRVNVGVLVVDERFAVARWNRFMAMHSGIAPLEALGRDLFELFPDLPRRWLTQKLRSVFLLGNYAFTSWEQRPYLFRFPHNRPATAASVDCMRQDCTFIPIRDATDRVTHVCITVTDVTDACIYQMQLLDAMRRLEEMSVRDALTGIFNRGHIEARLRDEVARSRRHGDPLSVILLDVDDFKRVNDRHGHKAGDTVLREVVRRITGNLRQHDVCGRYGGEEFTVVLPGTDLPSARVVAERLRRAVACQAVETSAGPIKLSITLGVAQLDPDTIDHEMLLDRADRALYQGKRAGRDRVMTAADGC